MIMLKQQELKHLFQGLAKNDVAQIDFGGSNITVRIDRPSKFSLSTPVYFGGNFIPKSVRQCLSQKVTFRREGMLTNFSVDESNFRVYLNYLGSLESINTQKFNELLEDFSWLAEEWRHYIDGHDKND